ncbi:maleylpyruvate isomerase family mycothiol-dependent enzyme [Actinomadura sp. KC216]|uniref:maleylpyruvate isomerase family mycothiol-dependent enzyme n=1 Tax=Actinomadura sp. KC216 TaxID=2530370 RepID=UPI0010434356|nr:maleylpyruvate isomerase family mycothiol-dependent enzyme [Actinomadura sp. KC216]TDB81213.1 maleylpyruvate isomerase family mycothiol-dependent enzyme [Actinomadura sp. KC216]
MPLAAIDAATRALLATADGFDDGDVRAPSLLPGWTRGHVLTHVARNADGGTRLLTWARTGVESYEYPSMEARAAEIEEGAGRPAAALVEDVRDSARRFADAYALMPDEAWTRTVQWTSGARHPAARAADSRLTEVLVHHVDLDAGFTPSDWPAEFTSRALDSVVAAFARREDAPRLRLRATDTGRELGNSEDHGAGEAANEGETRDNAKTPDNDETRDNDETPGNRETRGDDEAPGSGEARGDGKGPGDDEARDNDETRDNDEVPGNREARGDGKGPGDDEVRGDGESPGGGGGLVVVAGAEASLLAWLMGRSRGEDLTGAAGVTLPFLY